MSDQSVGVVGDGPAIEALTAALDDEGYALTRFKPETADSVNLAIVAAPVGDDRFRLVNARRNGPWIAIELGGIGGVPFDDVDAAVSVLQGSGPCFECLSTRVRSVLDSAPDDQLAVAGPDARLAGANAGRLAIDLLTGIDRLGTVRELPYAERHIWSVPGCICDEGRPPHVVRDNAAIALETTVAMAEQAVDPRLGPVVTVGEVETFPAPYYLAEACDTSEFSDVSASQHAAGVAEDWNRAFVKAIGEALERYAAGIYRSTSFAVASAEAIDDAVAPSRFVAPDHHDGALDADESIGWVPGEHLATGDPVQLPVERIYFPPPTERIAPAITTGLGLGTSGAGALVSGLTEVIERDAAMLAWYSTYDPLGVTVDDPNFDELTRRASAEGLSVTPLLVTQDIDVPVITVAVHRDEEWPRFAVGSAAALDSVKAACGALEEALQNWMELRAMGPEEASVEEPRIAEYAEFPPTVRSFVDIESSVPADRVGPVEVPSGTDELAALVARITQVGLDAYAARVTTRDVEAIGFEVVRVVVPGAQPLFTGDRFFGERARTVPRALGFRPRFDRPPHPYP